MRDSQNSVCDVLGDFGSTVVRFLQTWLIVGWIMLCLTVFELWSNAWTVWRWRRKVLRLHRHGYKNWSFTNRKVMKCSSKTSHLKTTSLTRIIPVMSPSWCSAGGWQWQGIGRRVHRPRRRSNQCRRWTSSACLASLVVGRNVRLASLNRQRWSSRAWIDLLPIFSL